MRDARCEMQDASQDVRAYIVSQAAASFRRDYLKTNYDGALVGRHLWRQKPWKFSRRNGFSREP
ncbi:hypothetical protein [Pseudoalteromonas shioyasakiensis]|uniref:hypothetical protein n=1 Tax=Pseudoalteromonas shioyasakiensis TaxID=1190813 RepID=UPI0022B1BC69|nr:hypothetical protein [Pseudoalteromonas shioyasakiensis]MCZ4252993.1 hypothetical protein [Pseudoalteromonas shioyasakiensis]